MNVIEGTPRQEVCHLDQALYARVHGEGDIWRAHLGTLGEVGETIAHRLVNEHFELAAQLRALRGEIRPIWPAFAGWMVKGLMRMVESHDDLAAAGASLSQSFTVAGTISEEGWQSMRTEPAWMWKLHREQIEDAEQFQARSVAAGQRILATGYAVSAFTDMAWAMYVRYPLRYRAFSGAIVHSLEAWAYWGAQGDVGKMAQSSRAGARIHSAAITGRKLLQLIGGKQ